MQKKFEDIDDFLEDPSFRNWVFGREGHRSLYWDNWGKNHPEKAPVMLQAKEILLQISDQEEDWDTVRQDEAFNALNKLLDEEISPREEAGLQKGPIVSGHKGNRYYISRWAAMIALIVFAGGGFLWFGNFNPEPTRADGEETWIIRLAERGQKKLIHLPDGSSVALNADTQIKYNKAFGISNREILLNGEAFFEVAKDSLLPFRVNSGDLSTEALGTSFNIRAFEEESLVQVRLMSGKVSVENRREKDGLYDVMYLSPGEEAVLTSQDFKKGKFDPSSAALWKDGILYFDEVPMEEALVTLERWYNVEITPVIVPEEMLVSGEFKRDNLDNVLRSLGYSFGFKYDIDGKRVTIQF